jgi:hypothetical protein
VVEEADETVFWLELLGDTSVVPKKDWKSYYLKQMNFLPSSLLRRGLHE